VAKSERTKSTAAHCVTEAAKNGGPMKFARMRMMQAINRHSRSETEKPALGKTKASDGPMSWARPRKPRRSVSELDQAWHVATGGCQDRSPFNPPDA
jgi:hypothetical protein